MFKSNPANISLSSQIIYQALSLVCGKLIAKKAQSNSAIEVSQFRGLVNNPLKFIKIHPLGKVTLYVNANSVAIVDNQQKLGYTCLAEVERLRVNVLNAIEDVIIEAIPGIYERHYYQNSFHYNQQQMQGQIQVDTVKQMIQPHYQGQLKGHTTSLNIYPFLINQSDCKSPTFIDVENTFPQESLKPQAIQSVDTLIYQSTIQKEDQLNDQKFKLSHPQQGLSDNTISHLFISTLLQPKIFINLQENAKFMFKSEHIIMLCDQAEAVIKEQPMVLRCKAPIKIFGDIHGQYSDLMRFFDLWGSPWADGKDGDIEVFDYLFLGDFVDRGSHSLETICLLFSLKIRYPEQIHLIRGNHEDKWINNGFGFSEECASRLGEDPNDDDSVFARVNKLFEWLPLAALVEDKIICLHGGIGSQLNYVSEIEQLQRPLEVIHEVTTPDQQLVVDILWSDPTDSDQEFGIQPNIIRDPAGTGNIVKFGPDRVLNFLIKNNLQLIIRAHECVMDGFERFAGGQLVTVSTAMNECGRHLNAGAMLVIKRNLEIQPMLIYPQKMSDLKWIEQENFEPVQQPTKPRFKNQNTQDYNYWN